MKKDRTLRDDTIVCKFVDQGFDIREVDKDLDYEYILLRLSLK